MQSALFVSNIFFLVSSTIFLALIVVSFLLMRSLKKRDNEVKKEKELSARRLYETTVAKEIGERIGYSLDVSEILSVITGSLRQFIDYTSVAYLVLGGTEMKFNIHFEKSVDHTYFSDVKKRTVDSLSALLNENINNQKISDVVSGAIEIDVGMQKVGSFFNIPLVVGGKLSAVLNVSSIEEGKYKEDDMTILYKIVSQASEQVTRLQEVVKTEQSKINSMVSSMGEGVMMVDKDYRIIVANPAVKEIIGIDDDRELSIFDFIDKLGGKFDIRGRLEESVVKNDSYVSDRIEINKFYYAIGVYPVTSEKLRGGSEILGAVVVFHDMSREVEVEQIREEYTSMIVHELRSPLDGIKKIMELVHSGKVRKGGKEFDDYLSMMLNSSSSMLELVNDILDISKIRAGKFEIHKTETDIKSLFEDRFMFYKPSAKSRGVDLSLSISNNVPKTINLDERAIKQVINNYVSNALKFTKEGGKVLVSVFVAEKGRVLPDDLERADMKVFPSIKDMNIEGKTLCIVVSDNGSGIKDEYMQNLFQSYVQVGNGSNNEKEKGTGLGLAISKGIAQAHGGNVGAISRSEEGSSFFFTLPLDAV